MQEEKFTLVFANDDATPELVRLTTVRRQPFISTVVDVTPRTAELLAPYLEINVLNPVSVSIGELVERISGRSRMSLVSLEVVKQFGLVGIYLNPDRVEEAFEILIPCMRTHGLGPAQIQKFLSLLKGQMVWANLPDLSRQNAECLRVSV